MGHSQRHCPGLFTVRMSARKTEHFVMLTLLAVVLATLSMLIYSHATIGEPTTHPGKCDNCFSYPHRYLINEEDLCGQYGPFGPQVIILVSSKPSSFEFRHTIRQTWGKSVSAYPGRARMAFILGYSEDLNKEILKESSINNDIIQGNFEDDQPGQTLKAVFMLKWISEYCAHASQLLKVDETVYLNLPLFLQHLLIQRLYHLESRDMLSGNCNFNVKPVRTPGYKGYVPYEYYPNTTYPPYCDSDFYLMPVKLARAVYNTSTKVLYFTHEGIFLGMALHRLGHSVTSDPRRMVAQPTSLNSYLEDMPHYFYCHCSMFFRDLPVEQFQFVYNMQVSMNCDTYLADNMVIRKFCFHPFVLKYYYVLFLGSLLLSLSLAVVIKRRFCRTCQGQHTFIKNRKT